MSEDVAVDLIKDVNTAFQNNCIKDTKLARLSDKLSDGNVTYSDAYSYATSIGNARAKAFKSQISPNELPDGRMYYNIASRLLENTLGEDYKLVSEFAQKVQKVLNEKSGISLNALKADKDNDRIKGFIDRISSEEDFSKIAWILDEPVKVHALSVVDDTIKKNTEFQNKAGVGVKVVRIAESNCCKWCADLDGTYSYPGVPGDVFARHDNCRCIVEYDGHKLTAYESKNGANTFRDQGEQERIEARIASNREATMDYRSVERDPNNAVELETSEGIINASLLKDSYNGIYISDNATIKPKKLDKIEKQIKSGFERTGINEFDGKIVIVSDTELGKLTGGRFDPDTNTVYIKPMIDESKQEYIITHELFHYKDFVEYIQDGGVYNNRSEYIDFISDKSKKILDKKGINEYNVIDLGDYASKSYRKGRYDETLTELRTINSFKRR